MQHVTSRHNARLREAARLLGSAHERRKARSCVLEGEHTVAAFLAANGSPRTLVVDHAGAARPAVRALIERADDATIVVPSALFADIGPLPNGVDVIAVVATPAPARTAPGDFCLLVDDVQDPGNVGSMLRSAAAAGVAQVWLSKRCAFAWSPKVLRAAQGAHFHVDIFEDVDLPAWAAAYRADGGRVVAAVAHDGASLFAARLDGRVAIAIGNEGAGLSAALVDAADAKVTIPMPGGFESLNAAAAAAVCLFECVRQRAKGSA